MTSRHRAQSGLSRVDPGRGAGTPADRASARRRSPSTRSPEPTSPQDHVRSTGSTSSEVTASTLGGKTTPAGHTGLARGGAVRKGEVLNEQLQTALNSRVVIEQAKGCVATARGGDGRGVRPAAPLLPGHSAPGRGGPPDRGGRPRSRSDRESPLERPTSSDLSQSSPASFSCATNRRPGLFPEYMGVIGLGRQRTGVGKHVAVRRTT